MSTKFRVKNFNIAVKEWKDRIIFLRKLVPGGTSRSYGVQVARIAGIPEEVIERAKEILSNLEKGEIDDLGRPRLARSEQTQNSQSTSQMNLFGWHNEGLIKRIRELDISSITPLDALVELDRIKKYTDELK